MNRHLTESYSATRLNDNQISLSDRLAYSMSFESNLINPNKYLTKQNSNQNKWQMQKNENEFSNYNNNYLENGTETYDEIKRYSYCYLCSIEAHVHTKTEPVPVNKRRYLRPYINPIQLMKKYEQKQIDPDLSTNYKFSIKTGPGQYSGTNSEVFFKLIGTSGIWNQTELKVQQGIKPMKFPPDSLIEAEINGPIIGDIKKLKIWHNGKSIKDGWWLDYVEISCAKLKQTWKFINNKWLSNHRPPDYKNTVTLNSISDTVANEKILNSVEYFLLIKTGDKPLPAADINVQFQFVGVKTQSIIFNLISPYNSLFESNQLDAFLITSSIDLGKPEKIRMALEHNDRKLPFEWTIEELKIVYSKEPNKFYTFRLDRWVDKNHKLNGAISPMAITSIDPSTESEPGKCIYHITVITGNVRMAGTDAQVFIEIVGEKGNTSIHRLNSSKSKKEFERNQTNHFHIFDANVGQIKAVRISHDNSGTAPGWFLDAVLIKSVTTTITGSKEKHDAEIKEQLEKLRKKFKARELKLNNHSSEKKRSSSAELKKPLKITVPPSPPRSMSADPTGKDSTKGALRKKLEQASSGALDGVNRASPTSSILKTSSSPRSARQDTRKQVKFNPKEILHHENSKPEDASQAKTSSGPKLDMKINWLMSVCYNEQKATKSMISIENFDKGLKNTDEKLLDKYYELASKKVAKSKEQELEEEKRNELSKKSRSKSPDNFIYVFECKNWLSKDTGDRRIERILKVKSILRN